MSVAGSVFASNPLDPLPLLRQEAFFFQFRAPVHICRVLGNGGRGGDSRGKGEERCLKNDEDVTVPFGVFHETSSGDQDYGEVSRNG